MKVSYEQRTDTLTVILKDDTPVFESDEDKPGVVLDYDAEGNLNGPRGARRLQASDRSAEGRFPDCGLNPVSRHSRTSFGCS